MFEGGLSMSGYVREYQNIWEYPREYAKGYVLEYLESIWRVSGEYLGSIWSIWIVSGKYLEYLESIWGVSEVSGEYLGSI